MTTVQYTEVDSQLLLELRIALLQTKPLPVSLLRVLAARGWAHPPTEVIEVRAALEDEPEATIEMFSQALAVPKLTHAGREEIRLHRRVFDDALVEGLIDEEEDEMDEWDEEEDDDPED